MPLTKMLCVALPTGLGAWLGWNLASPIGIMSGFMASNIGFALGWYLGRRYVRNVLE